MDDSKLDVIDIEKNKFIGRWKSSEGDEYFFYPDGTLKVNQTAYHFGMGVSSVTGYKIYEGEWRVIQVIDENGSSHFEFYTNYTCVKKKAFGEGLIFGSAIVPNHFPYEFKELNSTILYFIILPEILDNCTVKLEKVA